MATDLNKGFRASAAKLLLQIVSCCTAPELAPHMAVVEEAIAKGIVDANPDARSITKKTYDVYIRRFSSRKDSLHSLIEPLHLSASNASVPAANKPISEGNSPTMTVFDDVESAAAAEAKDDASAPAISQEISSENSPAPATEQPVETAAVEDIVASATSGEPPAIQEQGSSSNLPTSGRTTPTEQSKNPDSKPAATRASTTDTAKTTAARAHRMHGLSFSSLKGSAGSSGPRTPHAVRPAARNIVTSRMEEALRGRPRARPRPKPVEKAAPTTRARRPVRTAATHADKSAAESPSRRMTLRSDTKIEPLTSLDDNVPGYLRATAASAHRTAELAGEQRSTRRRKREGSQEPSSEEPAAKATKTDAVAAASAVSSN
ncbi:hypothetical protein FBU59_002626 [Linderina macrospora]|uniref:Uncharacterized protein n=1 Tax=Linderina macrospora TaxID=4868 RepID=A0ACC1JAN5_9FUNG|nr:hypothetical protein FBU59_002626 [Linderina macrospora]